MPISLLATALCCCDSDSRGVGWINAMWLCAQQSYVMVGLLIVSKGVEMAGESVVVCVMFRCLGGVKA